MKRPDHFFIYAAQLMDNEAGILKITLTKGSSFLAKKIFVEGEKNIEMAAGQGNKNCDIRQMEVADFNIFSFRVAHAPIVISCFNISPSCRA